jgi:hypothetical protein
MGTHPARMPRCRRPGQGEVRPWPKPVTLYEEGLELLDQILWSHHVVRFLGCDRGGFEQIEHMFATLRPSRDRFQGVV